MFGNQNKKRKIKRLQREKQRAKIKKGKAIAAEKKRLRKLQEQQRLENSDEESNVNNNNNNEDINLIINDGATATTANHTSNNEAIDILPNEKEIAKQNSGETMSRRKRKFLQKLEEKKAKKANRQALFESLSASKLSPAHSKLLVKSATLGQRETLRDTLRRDLYFERAGLKQDSLESTNNNDNNDDDDNNNNNAIGSSSSSNNSSSSSKNATKKMLRQEARKRRRERKKQEKREKMEELKRQDEENKLAMDVSSSDESIDEDEDINDHKEEDKNMNEKQKEEENSISSTELLQASSSSSSSLNAISTTTTDNTTNVEKIKKFTMPKPTAFFVPVKRDPQIQKERMLLPVCGMEQEIIEAIQENLFVILCGETGSGKTTQLPQFLYESGYGDKNSNNPGMIGVTQPRRVAAVTMASRIAKELNVKWGKGGTVAHQIRYDTRTVSENTKLKLMTDGVLLREIRSDFLLRKYSIIIIDEAHERGVNTDLLIGLLSRIVPLRKKLAIEQQTANNNNNNNNNTTINVDKIYPLKVVIMSATLNVKDFSENTRLFPPLKIARNEIQKPKIINVESRRYPITIHFNKQTATVNYLDATFRKVCKIHNKLPAGGILVFLTGKRDIEYFCDKVRKRFDSTYKNASNSNISEAKREEKNKALRRNNVDKFDDDEEDNNLSLLEDGNKDLAEGGGDNDDDDDFQMFEEDLINNLRGEGGDWELDEDDDFEEEEEVVILNAEKNEKDNDKTGDKKDGANANESENTEDSKIPTNVIVLPLYAMLPQHRQLKVFDAVSPNTRLIVISTNVAETSITIPGIKYVVDPGREKARVYDQKTGASKFEIDWISKASASQRAGRCGRTGPGHCYRLYSSAMYNDNFQQQLAPEILSRPIEDLILNMKSMFINNIETFPFPTPPNQDEIQHAISSLQCLGAITPSINNASDQNLSYSINTMTKKGNNKITHVGEQMALFPLPPRFSKMLLLGLQQDDLIAYTISLVASLSVQSPFLGEISKKFKHTESDALRLLRVVGAYSYAVENSNTNNKKQAAKSFCKKYQLHARTMYEIQRLRRQLKNIITRTLVNNESSGKISTNITNALNLPPPTEKHETLLLQLVGASFIDRIARLAPVGTWVEADENRKRMRCAYQSCNLKLANKPLWIHASSGVVSKDFRRLPRYVVYQEIIETSKPYMVRVTAISEDIIARLGRGTPMVEFSAPLDAPLPSYDATLDRVVCTSKPTFGPHRWELPATRIPINETSSVSPGSSGSSISSSGTTTEEIECRWFSRLLFEGKVVAPIEFKSLLSLLSVKPTTITHARFNRFGLSITQELLMANVSNLKTLQIALEKHPNLLRDTLSQFVHKDKKQVDLLECWDMCKKCIVR